MKKSMLKWLLVMIITTTQLHTQTRNRSLHFINSKIKISINGHIKRDAVFHVHIKNLTLLEEQTIKTSGVATVLLQYNMKYEITITHAGCNTKVIEVNTDAPIDKWFIVASINLSDKENGVIKAGSINYDNDSRTFITKETI